MAVAATLLFVAYAIPTAHKNLTKVKYSNGIRILAVIDVTTLSLVTMATTAANIFKSRIFIFLCV